MINREDGFVQKLRHLFPYLTIPDIVSIAQNFVSGECITIYTNIGSITPFTPYPVMCLGDQYEYMKDKPNLIFIAVLKPEDFDGYEKIAELSTRGPRHLCYCPLRDEEGNVINGTI